MSEITAPYDPTFFEPHDAPDILDKAIVRGIDLLENPVVLNQLSSDHNSIVLKIGLETPNHEEHTVRKTYWQAFRNNLNDTMPPDGTISNREELEATADTLQR